MDADALMIGDAPHEDAIRFFESRTDVGMLGAFKRRGDGSDKTHAMALKGRQLTREMRLRDGFRNLALMTSLRRMVKRAEAQGYTRGDMYGRLASCGPAQSRRWTSMATSIWRCSNTAS